MTELRIVRKVELVRTERTREEKDTNCALAEEIPKPLRPIPMNYYPVKYALHYVVRVMCDYSVSSPWLIRLLLDNTNYDYPTPVI